MRFADDPAGPSPPLAPGPRALGLAAGWGLYVLAGPGVLCDEASPLGLVGVALWGLVARRPGRFALPLETLAAALGLSAQLYWIDYVFPLAMVWVAVGCALYGALASLLLRRLSRRFRPALALPAAWIGMETLRMTLPPPFGLSWLSLGHYALDVPALAGSARLWGAVGLGCALAALAGLVVEIVEWRRGLRPAPDARGAALGLGPALVGAVVGSLPLAPRTVDGPRLLLVQPAFPQARKQSAGEPSQLFVEQLHMTRDALAAERAAGRPAPDMVCWGETMLMVTLAEDGLEAAAEAGLELADWWRLAPQDVPLLVEQRRRHEAEWVAGTLYGAGARAEAVLPEGTSFLAGAELLVAHAGALRRMNVVGLWSGAGERVGVAAKRHLAPGGETMLGLERLGFVRDYIYEVAAYVPDFLAAERTGVLELETRAGRRHPFGATICFDNAFPQAYAEPLTRGPLDFHLVVSNEAWYLESPEMDQMIAFSRLEALATGRAVVRATNAGISAALGPDGEELARLTVGGEDKLVTGTLAVTVPVPAADDDRRPPFVATWALWNAAALLAPALLALLAGRRAVTSGGEGGSPEPRPAAPQRA